jgi:predicted  nucleic acid-binding Zn-ribbon protein
MPWECASCANFYDGPSKPSRCPECGSRKLISDEPERERDEDDGSSGYSDPRDERDERRAR